MRDLYEVLRQKEQEYKRLAKEIEALRITASLLAEEKAEHANDGAKTAIAVAAAGSQTGPRAVDDTVSRWP
ncbi:MAG TPA: hypothetical protein VE998_04825 [Terriglobales bacterium]|nr:hypothetical protein [Terriglobales bacterium]